MKVIQIGPTKYQSTYNVNEFGLEFGGIFRFLQCFPLILLKKVAREPYVKFIFSESMFIWAFFYKCIGHFYVLGKKLHRTCRTPLN